MCLLSVTLKKNAEINFVNSDMNKRSQICMRKGDIVDKYLIEMFEKLTEDEKFESGKVLCDFICRAPHGYHRCFTDEDFEGSVSCDIPNITMILLGIKTTDSIHSV